MSLSEHSFKFSKWEEKNLNRINNRFFGQSLNKTRGHLIIFLSPVQIVAEILPYTPHWFWREALNVPEMSKNPVVVVELMGWKPVTLFDQAVSGF